MGVKIRERKLAGGEVAFYIDVYHGEIDEGKPKRFSVKTGLQENPKNRKAFNLAKAEAEDQRRGYEKDFQADPKGLFDRKAKSAGDFVEYLRTSIENTSYPVEVNALKKIVSFSGGAVPFDKLNNEWLERFKVYLLSEDSINQNTAASYLGLISKTIRQAWRSGFIKEDFTGKVTRIKQKKREDIQRNYLTLDDIEALHNAYCKNEMLKQAFLFGCFSGLRISDIELLTWDKISFVNGAPFIKFRQKKTGGYEECAIPEQAVKILMEVKKLHPEFAPDGNDRVFILPNRQLISKILHIWGREAGLTWDLHFHVSRHTMAVMMLSSGSDIYAVSKQLGHDDIGTTQIYCNLASNARVREVNRLPTLSEPSAVAISPVMIVSSQEQINQPEKVLTPKAGSIAAALEAEGESVAKALRLKKSPSGRYMFDGREYSAKELAIAVSKDE
jgi:integrase